MVSAQFNLDFLVDVSLSTRFQKKILFCEHWAPNGHRLLHGPTGVHTIIFMHGISNKKTSVAFVQNNTESSSMFPPFLSILSHWIFFVFVLLTHKESHWEVYLDFQPSLTSFAGGAKGGLDHWFLAPPTYTTLRKIYLWAEIKTNQEA